MAEIISTHNMFDFVANLSTSSEKNIHNIWKNVVLKIKSSTDDENQEKHMPMGERLASNTRVVDLKNKVLLVETDHSGWIQYLKIYQNFILKGLQLALPDLEIKSLAFRIRGTSYNLSSSYDENLSKAKEKINQTWEEQEKALKQTDKASKSKKSSNLPPELLEKFKSIRQSIKENSNKIDQE